MSKNLPRHSLASVVLRTMQVKSFRLVPFSCCQRSPSAKPRHKRHLPRLGLPQQIRTVLSHQGQPPCPCPRVAVQQQRQIASADGDSPAKLSGTMPTALTF